MYQYGLCTCTYLMYTPYLRSGAVGYKLEGNKLIAEFAEIRTVLNVVGSIELFSHVLS